MTCTHGGALLCVQCKHGTDDVLEASVAEAREAAGDDELAADIAEALVRRAGMSYLDGVSPEEAGRIAAEVARRRGHR